MNRCILQIYISYRVDFFVFLVLKESQFSYLVAKGKYDLRL